MTTSVTGNAQAFGYSITITYGVVSSVHRDPPVAELLLLALAPTGPGGFDEMVRAR